MTHQQMTVAQHMEGTPVYSTGIFIILQSSTVKLVSHFVLLVSFRTSSVISPSISAPAEMSRKLQPCQEIFLDP